MRQSLTIESRLPMGADGPVRPHHTQDMSWETRSARRPAPGRIVGPTPPASDPRQRVARWQQVVARFPSDDLARAALADNAASLAGAEHDIDALDLAIETYEHLLSKAEDPAQRAALDTALTSLRGWKL